MLKLGLLHIPQDLNSESSEVLYIIIIQCYSILKIMHHLRYLLVRKGFIIKRSPYFRTLLKNILGDGVSGINKPVRGFLNRL